jgi:intraflagellar transport protein 122
MLTSLRQFNAAKEFAENYGAGDVGSMMGRQGEWAEGEGEWAEAAGMYVAAGETARAVALLASRGLYDELAALVPAMEKVRDEAELRACLVHFKGAGRTRDAEDVVRRLGDDAELLKLYIDARDWAAAFRLAESDANLDAAPIHLPYAYWLAEQDRFEEAQAAFARAGVPGKALELLESLTRNAVLESRFADAARYYFVLAMEHLTVAGRAAAGSADRAVNTARFEAHYQRGEYYFAYDIVHRHSVNPFTETQPESLFNVAAFLINSAGAGGGAAGKRGGGSAADRQPETPLGTSRAFILHALATSAASIGAHKTARTAHDRLAALRVPDAWAGRVEVEALRARARPFADADGTASTCMRCGGESPALGPTGGDACVTCGQRFQRSFAGSFEHLPVVEFVPADGIDDDLAVRLIEQEPMGPRTASGIAAPSSSAESTSRIGGSEVLTLGGGGDGGDDGAGLNDPAEDPFTALLQRYEQADGARGPLVCDRDTLVRIPSNEVYVKRWPGGVRRNEYFRNMLFGEIPITLCERCNHLFSQEDYESEVLTDRRCPFCKTVPEGGLDQ